MTTYPQPPGSHEALAAGCTCPRQDNGYGRGVYIDRDTKETIYWLSSNCPLHVGKLSIDRPQWVRITDDPDSWPSAPIVVLKVDYSDQMSKYLLSFLKDIRVMELLKAYRASWYALPEANNA